MKLEGRSFGNTPSGELHHHDPGDSCGDAPLIHTDRIGEEGRTTRDGEVCSEERSGVRNSMIFALEDRTDGSTSVRITTGASEFVPSYRTRALLIAESGGVEEFLANAPDPIRVLAFAGCLIDFVLEANPGLLEDLGRMLTEHPKELSGIVETYVSGHMEAIRTDLLDDDHPVHRALQFFMCSYENRDEEQSHNLRSSYVTHLAMVAFHLQRYGYELVDSATVSMHFGTSALGLSANGSLIRVSPFGRGITKKYSRLSLRDDSNADDLADKYEHSFSAATAFLQIGDRFPLRFSGRNKHGDLMRFGASSPLILVADRVGVEYDPAESFQISEAFKGTFGTKIFPR
jgi:hypothetical protein